MVVCSHHSDVVYCMAINKWNRGPFLLTYGMSSAASEILVLKWNQPKIDLSVAGNYYTTMVVSQKVYFVVGG